MNLEYVHEFDIDQICMSLSNDENSTDEELVEHLDAYTKVPKEILQRIVAEERPEFFRDCLRDKPDVDWKKYGISILH